MLKFRFDRCITRYKTCGKAFIGIKPIRCIIDLNPEMKAFDQNVERDGRQNGKKIFFLN